MTNRFESISGILTRTTGGTGPDAAAPSKAADDEADAEPAPVTTLRPAGPGTPAGGRRRTADPAPRPQPKSATVDGGVRRIAFRLDPDLYAALTARAGQDCSSHGQVVLDSIEAAHTAGNLAGLVAHDDPVDAAGLFPRLRTRGPSRPTVPVEIRLHARAAAVLDTLVQQTRADSRTRLITAALHHHLS